MDGITKAYNFAMAELNALRRKISYLEGVVANREVTIGVLNSLLVRIQNEKTLPAQEAISGGTSCSAIQTGESKQGNIQVNRFAIPDVKYTKFEGALDDAGILWRRK